MRILIIHNTLNDSTSVSGVLRHYAYMATAWAAMGHPTDFLAARAGWPQLRQLAPAAGLISSDDWFDASGYIAQTWRYFPAYGYRMARAHWQRFEPHYDVIYASSQLIFETYPALVLQRRRPARLALKIHHVLAAQPARKGLFDRLFLWSERQSARWMNRRAETLICSTPIVGQDWAALELQLGLTPLPAAHIGYGLDLSLIQPGPPAAKKFDVVFLGRLHEHKGVFDMPGFWAEIVARRPEARLVVVGEGPHRARTQALFQERGLLNSVTFTGGISETAKNEYLAQARVGVSLSYEEGWGLSVMEFLGAALPVAAYSLPVFAHAFPGQLELVPKGDWRALAQKTLAFLTDPDRALADGVRGREFVARYDYRRVAEAELCALQAGTRTHHAQ